MVRTHTLNALTLALVVLATASSCVHSTARATHTTSPAPYARGGGPPPEHNVLPAPAPWP